MTPGHTAVVFEESFELQDALIHQRASSSRLLTGERGDVLVVIIWCGGVCVTVIVPPSSGGVRTQ